MPLLKSPTLTPARLAANRRNALKSTGPKTAAGKRRSALNARSRNLCPQKSCSGSWFTCSANGTSGGITGWLPSWGGRWDLLPKCAAGSSRDCSSSEPGREGGTTLGSPAQSACSQSSRKLSAQSWQEKLPHRPQGLNRRPMRRAKPNKPNRLKTLVINELAHEAEKQTQARYQPWYQSLTAILAPILKKFVWIASALLRIRADARIPVPGGGGQRAQAATGAFCRPARLGGVREPGQTSGPSLGPRPGAEGSPGGGPC